MQDGVGACNDPYIYINENVLVYIRNFHSIHSCLRRVILILCPSNLTPPSLLVTVCVILLTETWTAQAATGENPPALCAYALVMIDKNKAALFGGWDGRKMHNDTYILDTDVWV